MKLKEKGNRNAEQSTLKLGLKDATQSKGGT
jgi:hypothetical protein